MTTFAVHVFERLPTSIERCIKNSTDPMAKTHIVSHLRDSFNSSYIIDYKHNNYESNNCIIKECKPLIIITGLIPHSHQLKAQVTLANQDLTSHFVTVRKVMCT